MFLPFPPLWGLLGILNLFFGMVTHRRTCTECEILVFFSVDLSERSGGGEGRQKEKHQLDVPLTCAPIDCFSHMP